MEFIEVDYPTLARDPQSVIASVVEFLGSDRLPNAEKMAAVVDASLYRRRRDAA
jgi:LPS sulfotransferase NodH